MKIDPTSAILSLLGVTPTPNAANPETGAGFGEMLQKALELPVAGAEGAPVPGLKTANGAPPVLAPAVKSAPGAPPVAPPQVKSANPAPVAAPASPPVELPGECVLIREALPEAIEAEPQPLTELEEPVEVPEEQAQERPEPDDSLIFPPEALALGFLPPPPPPPVPVTQAPVEARKAPVVVAAPVTAALTPAAPALPPELQQALAELAPELTGPVEMREVPTPAPPAAAPVPVAEAPLVEGPVVKQAAAPVVQAQETAAPVARPQEALPEAPLPEGAPLPVAAQGAPALELVAPRPAAAALDKPKVELTVVTPAAEPAVRAESTAPAVPVERVPEPVSPHHLAQELHPRIIKAMAQAIPAERKVELKLNPEKLGELKVEIKLEADQGVRLHVQASSPEVLPILEAQAQDLGERLKDAGLALKEFSSSFTPGQGQGQRQDSSERRPHYPGYATASDEPVVRRPNRGYHPASTRLSLKV